jgi:hypothetical protein
VCSVGTEFVDFICMNSVFRFRDMAVAVSRRPLGIKTNPSGICGG